MQNILNWLNRTIGIALIIVVLMGCKGAIVIGNNGGDNGVERSGSQLGAAGATVVGNNGGDNSDNSDNRDNRVAGTLVFLWYSQGREHERGQLHSVLGLYDSTDPRVQKQHIEWWKEAGINLVLLSWWGANNGSSFREKINEAASGYILRLEQEGLRWAIWWELGTDEASLSQISEWSKYPHYYRIAGKPVLFVYSRIYEERPLADRTFWDEMGTKYYLVFDRVPIRGIASLPEGTGYTYWDVPFTVEDAYIEKLEAAENNPNISRFHFVNHGFDNTGFSDPGLIWPKDVPGYPDGSSIAWLNHQYELATCHSPTGIIFPFNEFGEHSAFEPTDPDYGGWGTLFFDRMKELISKYQTENLCP